MRLVHYVPPSLLSLIYTLYFTLMVVLLYPLLLVCTCVHISYSSISIKCPIADVVLPDYTVKWSTGTHHTNLSGTGGSPSAV